MRRLNIATSIITILLILHTVLFHKHLDQYKNELFDSGFVLMGSGVASWEALFWVINIAVCFGLFIVIFIKSMIKPDEMDKHTWANLALIALALSIPILL